MVTNTTELIDPLGLPQAGESWWVLHTLSRREKRIAVVCERLGIRHYLSRRGPRSLVPLFPGYLFVCPIQEAYGELMRTGTIARRIPVRRPEVLLGELRGIRAVLAAGVGLVSAPALGRGRRARVIGGALRGIMGIVADHRIRRGRVHLVLNVTMLGQGALVEIDVEDVEPAEGWQRGERLFAERSGDQHAASFPG